MALTAQLLRDAADLICPDTWAGDHECTFMCIAVEQAADSAYGLYADRAESKQAFDDLLEEHGVSNYGDLGHETAFPNGTDHLTREERQALRFDFLNLLAHSLDKPRWTR